jgi:hypothetical protein
MANIALFRTGQSPEYIPSAETSIFASDPDAIVNPDLSAVTGLEPKFWKRSGNSVLAMNATEQNLVLANELIAQMPPEVSDIRLVEHFICSVVGGTLNWVAVNSGTGAAVAVNTSLVTNVNIGILQLITGTTATGRSSIHLGAAVMAFGGGQCIFEVMVRIEDLSTPTERFKFYVGVGDQTGAGDMVDGVYFSYSDADDGGVWRGCTANNSVRSTVPGSVVAADTWYKLKASVNAAGTLVRFSVNGVWIGDLNANIPITNARATGPICKLEKSIGLTARLAYIDSYFLNKTI